MKGTQGQAWFQYLSHGQQDLVSEAFILLEREKQGSQEFHDYSFIVFPMAKAYEGFLKKFFLDIGIITTAHFNSSHFRIGKSLNPDLPSRYRRQDWVVDRLDKACPAIPPDQNGQKLSHVLWRAWRQYRNQLFHFFPGHAKFISLDEAESGLKLLSEAMHFAVQCSILVNHGQTGVK